MKRYFYLLLLLVNSSLAFLQDTTMIINPCEDDTEIYNLAEIDPKFPSGEDSMLLFFMKNIVIPPNSICGSWLIYVGFVVNTDGSLCDITIIKGSGLSTLDYEALRVVQSMPNWIPAQNGDKIVRSRYVVPVTIKIM